MSSIQSSLPKEGIAGLKENFRFDFISGFLVFLLALPLSLGIAKASEFPPAMGVLTAMIGGLFVSFFAGSRLTIKGPAAGLITICAGCVTELGGGPEGWHLALGAIVVASWIQIILGFLKAGSLSDFIPHSAVHGMLAAIGIIIFSKQTPILLGIDPSTLKAENKNQFPAKNSSTDDCAVNRHSSGFHVELQHHTTGSYPCSYRRLLGFSRIQRRFLCNK